MSKYIKHLILLLVAGVSMASCQRYNGSEGGEGKLVIEYISDTGTISRAADNLVYKLDIYDMNGALVAQYNDHTTVPMITLKEGKYRIVATHGDNPEAAFDAPYYKGEQTTDIKAGGTTSTTIITRLANVKVTIGFSDVIKENFTKYDVVVTNANGENAGGELTFTKDDVGRAAYLKATGSLKWTLNLTNNQGTEYSVNKTLTNVQPRDHYRLNFSVSTNDEDTGGGMFGLVIDSSTDVKEHDYAINIKKKNRPVIVGDGFDITLPLLINETSRGAKAKVLFAAQATLQEMVIRHHSNAVSALGIPETITPTSMSTELQQKVNAAGISWSNPLLDATEGYIDLSGIANKLPLGEYTFEMSFYDGQKQLVTKPIVLNVIPDQDHMTLGSEPWAKFAILRGQWNALEKPQGMTFQYRVQGQTEWVTVPENLIEADASKKAFTARVPGLSAETSYQFRTYAPGTKDANVLTFATEAAPVLPNLKFEEWHQSGKTWYPNASGGNSYWATGNEGVNGWPVSMESTTQPVDDAISGKAVRMISKPINVGISPVKFAAGNLFTGTYSTDISNPVNSVRFGRPYTGRPIAITGWYKYKSMPIVANKHTPADLVGTRDRMHIYLSLENWNGASERPANPTVVAYGELQSDVDVAEYKQFRIDMKYNTTTEKPTHAVMAVTSSYKGGVFIGGTDSELYVDEFELLFE